MGDGATVGVGVDQQHLPAGGGRLEGKVDGDGGAPRAALGPPDGGQGPPGVGVRLGRDLAGLWRFVAEVGFGGQRGPGPVDQGVRRVGVGGDVQEPELAEPALAVLVTGRGHADHGQPGGGQPGQGVTVQPPGSGGDHRHLGLAGGGHGSDCEGSGCAASDGEEPDGEASDGGSGAPLGVVGAAVSSVAGPGVLATKIRAVAMAAATIGARSLGMRSWTPPSCPAPVSPAGSWKTWTTSAVGSRTTARPRRAPSV
jgi:hypothetical protein